MRTLLLILLCCIPTSGILAQESSEPSELTRLREQFENRIERDLAPLRVLYRKELEKLEQRMVQQDRLADALTVRREREKASPIGADTGSKKVDTSIPLEEFLVGTVWEHTWTKGSLSGSSALIFVEEGKARFYGAEIDTARWRVVNKSEIEIRSTGKDPYRLTVSRDRTSYEGEGSSLDRKGKLIGMALAE